MAARGADLTNPPDQTTTQEWLDAYRAEPAEAETARDQVTEAELADPQHQQDQAAADAVAPTSGPVAETGLAEADVPDIRDTSQPDAFEYTDPQQRRRGPEMAETREKVQHAQEAVAELAAREELDAAADVDEDEAEIARYGALDPIDEQVDDQVDELGSPDPVLEYAAGDGADVDVYVS